MYPMFRIILVAGVAGIAGAATASEIVAPTLNGNPILIDQVGTTNVLSRDGLTASGSNGAVFSGGNGTSLDVQQVQTTAGAANRIGLDVRTSGGLAATLRQGAATRTARSGSTAPSVTATTTVVGNVLQANVGNTTTAADLTSLTVTQSSSSNTALLALGSGSGDALGASTFSLTQEASGGHYAAVNLTGTTAGAWSIAQRATSNQLLVNANNFIANATLDFVGGSNNARDYTNGGLVGAAAGINLTSGGTRAFGLTGNGASGNYQVDLTAANVNSAVALAQNGTGAVTAIHGHTGALLTLADTQLPAMSPSAAPAAPSPCPGGPSPPPRSPSRAVARTAWRRRRPEASPRSRRPRPGPVRIRSPWPMRPIPVRPIP